VRGNVSKPVLSIAEEFACPREAAFSLRGYVDEGGSAKPGPARPTTFNAVRICRIVLTTYEIRFTLARRSATARRHEIRFQRYAQARFELSVALTELERLVGKEL